VRKKLKTGTVPTSVGRFKAMYSNEEQKYSADYRRDSDSGFCGLKELLFAYAQRSGTDDRFNKEKKKTPE